MAFLKESVRVEVIHAFVAGHLALCVSGNILQPVSAYMPVYCRHCNQRALNANIAQIVQQRLHGHRDSPYSTQAVGHPHPHSLRVTVLLGLNPLGSACTVFPSSRVMLYLDMPNTRQSRV